MKKTFILFIFCIVLCSCTAYKKLPYLVNTELVAQDSLMTNTKNRLAKIKSNDILSIIVSSTIPGAANDFNLPLIPASSNQSIQTTISNSTNASGSIQNYIVDSDGYINFPVLGKIYIANYTVEEAQNYITSLIYPKYISTEPIVNIRFLNFEVSVLGEVAKPGIYKSQNGIITILDALAFAGDMTIYGKRNNVLLVRTASDGQVHLHRIDMQNKDLVLNNNLFYLQQNDKIYIETNNAKGNSSRFGTLESLGISAISILISIIAIVTR